MNKININYLVVGLMLFVTTSCEDILDRPPLDEISNEAYWKTASDLKNYTMQFYTIFPTYGTPGGTGIFHADASYGSDDAILVDANTTLNGASPIINSGGEWTWNKIRSINIFFDNYAQCKDKFSLWSQYLGEAYFFRAYLYFDKVQNYGDVPWYNKSLNMDSEELYKGRDPRTLVVDSILSDLDKAVKFLNPIAKTEGGTNRLSKEVALLFKSRVALYEGSWQKYHAGTSFGTQGVDPKKYFRIAVDAAEELMNGDYTVGIYGKNSDDYGLMFGMDDMSSNHEILLWKAYDKSLGLSHDSQINHTSKTGGRSATMEFVEAFLSHDGEPIDYYELAKTKKGSEFLSYIGENADPRLRQTIWIPGDVMWNNSNGYKAFNLPYLGQSGAFFNSTGYQLRKGVDITSPGAGGSQGGNSVTGAIIFRFAEVLLNYAEAKYELDGSVDYNKSINLLRKRVGMPDFKVLKDPNAKRFSNYGYELSDELFEIRRERRVELGAEGYRNQDYRRWRAHKLFQSKRPKGFPVLKEEYPEGTRFPTIDVNGFLDPLKNTIPDGYGFREERDYLQCIPTNEITLNPNLDPNPGW